MFGGMHKLHELSDKEKLIRKMIRDLHENRCNIDDVKIEHTRGCVPMLSCKLETPYREYLDVDKSLESLWNYTYNDIKSIDELWPSLDLMRKRDGEKIKKVIFNDPVTVVLWNDGTKTIVKCEGEEFDPEKGLAMAIAKKYLGTNKNRSNYYDAFKKWIPENKTKVELTSEGLTFTFENGSEVTKRLGKIFGTPTVWFGKGE